MSSYIIDLLLFYHYLLWIIKILPWRPEGKTWFRRGSQTLNANFIRFPKLHVKLYVKLRVPRSSFQTSADEFAFSRLRIHVEAHRHVRRVAGNWHLRRQTILPRVNRHQFLCDLKRVCVLFFVFVAFNKYVHCINLIAMLASSRQ